MLDCWNTGNCDFTVFWITSAVKECRERERRTMSCLRPMKDCSTELAVRTWRFMAACSPRKRSIKSLTASPCITTHQSASSNTKQQDWSRKRYKSWIWNRWGWRMKLWWSIGGKEETAENSLKVDLTFLKRHDGKILEFYLFIQTLSEEIMNTIWGGTLEDEHHESPQK